MRFRAVRCFQGHTAIKWWNSVTQESAFRKQTMLPHFPQDLYLDI